MLYALHVSEKSKRGPHFPCASYVSIRARQVFFTMNGERLVLLRDGWRVRLSVHTSMAFKCIIWLTSYKRLIRLKIRAEKH